MKGSEMTKRALLIGINEYKDDQVPDLHGCVNDVELIQDILQTHYQFAPQDITRLVDDPGNTRDGIFDALDALIDATQPGDVALIFYSGHGSQAPDENAEEEDKWDETIVPSDSGRVNLPVRDIIDDELHSYLSALAQRTDRATFVFDSCHSGSVDRALLAPAASTATMSPRAIPRAATPPEGDRRMRPEAPRATGKESSSGMVKQGEYVLIAGCLDAQTSKETDFEGQRDGALTYFLAGALKNQPETLQQAFDAAAQGVRQAVEDQDPVLEGPASRLSASPF
jgi:uncharacterized caspase-like protein